MKKQIHPLLGLFSCGLLTMNTCLAEQSFSESLQNGSKLLKLRYRFEHVDQDNFNRDANASTVLTRLSYTSQAYKGFSFSLEADNVSEVFSDNYNAAAGNTPNRGQFPVVADPDGTEINQAWLKFGAENFSIKAGRQRINFDDQRFIGGVAWRQNEQTYDALSTNINVADGQLQAIYVNNVNRIFGPDVPPGDHDNQSWLLHWQKKWNQHKLSVFYYDIDNEDLAAFSTATYGFKYASNVQYNEQKFNLGLSVAQQRDNANNPVNFDALYYRFDCGVQLDTVNLFAGYEVLEGDAQQAGASFRTPLATLHAFNGWSDQFLVTPQNGIADTFIGLKGKHNKHSWLVRYHDFKSEVGSIDYGTEFNAQWVYKFDKQLSLLLKAAFYDADQFNTDTTKFWLMLTYQFRGL